MNLETLTSKFQNLYGIDLSVGNHMFILEQAIKAISEEYPKIITVEVATVKDQHRYVVPNDGLIKIAKVYYNRQHLNDSTSLQPTPGEVQSPNYSLTRQFTEIIEKEFYDKMNPVDAQIVDYNAFDLIPAPTVTGLGVPCECEFYRELSEIPSFFEDCIFKLFFYYLREDDFMDNMRKNNGNVYKFDRRGNIGAESSDSEVEKREQEFERIIKDIRKKVLKIRV